jgi:signal-transduction protein with cAMP-binding, CBS, and nucleotidyltransferase domain
MSRPILSCFAYGACKDCDIEIEARQSHFGQFAKYAANSCRQDQVRVGKRYLLGGVKLTVVNEVGKEAVVAILAAGDFFGEGCLAGQSVRIGTATAITPCTVLVIEKGGMFKVLHEQHALSDRFIKFMLARNIRIEEDLVDQLFNSSERRLARTLLLLARYGKEDQPHGVLPKMSQENAGGDDRHNTPTG